MTTLERIRRVAATRGINNLDLDTDLDALGFDSIDWVDMIYGLEKEFGCYIPDHVADYWQNVQDIVSYLEGAEGEK